MKKILSVFVIASLIASLFVCNVSAANTSKTVTAAQFTVSAGGEVTDGPEGFSFGAKSSPSYGKAVAAKETGIYGLLQSEYGIKMIAGWQKADDPYFAFDFGDIDASEDFYITTNAYIGMQPESDYVRLGTRLMKEDETELTNGQNFQGYKHFVGNGMVKFRTDSSNEKYMNASYTANNWVNYTIAGTNGTITVYIDGVGISSGYVSGISGGNKTVSYSGILKDVNPTIQFGTSDKNSLGDIPSIAVFKDMKLVAGAYNPEQSKTTVTSSRYTVPDANVILGSSTDNIEAVKPVISGVSENETVSEFLSNITAPSGSTKSVVKINNQTGATTVMGNSEKMSSDMKLLVKSADGSMKLYSIKAGLTGLLYFDTTGYTASGYSINDADQIITVMPHTTVETLTAILKTNKQGITYSVLRKNGQEYASGALTENMKVYVTDGTKSVKYSIAFKDTAALNVGAKLGTVADDTVLFTASGMDVTFDYTGRGLLGINHTSSGYTQMEKANPKVAATGSYTVTKTNMPGHTEDNRVNAWHFTETDNTGGWRKHSSNALGMHSGTGLDKGKKTILTFKAYLGNNGGLSIAPRHAYGSKPDCTDIQYTNTSNTGFGDRITFTDGDIKLGGQNRDWSLAGYGSNYYAVKGAYSEGEEYNVVLVESRGEKEIDGMLYSTVVTEGIYVNGTNILSGSEEMVIKDGRDYFAIRDITFQTIGDVYIGGLRIYMADEYSIPEEGVDDVDSDKIINLSNALNGIEDGTLLLKVQRTTDSAFGAPTVAYTNEGGYLPGFTGTNAGISSKIKDGDALGEYYQVYKDKIPGTTIDAYKFTYPKGNDSNKSTRDAAHKVGNVFSDSENATNGKKMVINFKLYIPSADNGKFMITPYHYYGTGAEDIQYTTGDSSANTGIGDRVTFDTDGNVKLGGLIRRGGYGMELARKGNTYGETINSYSRDTLYDVKIVQSRGTWENGVTIVTEGIYLNGTNILSTPNETIIGDGRAYSAMREIEIATAGTVYMSGLNVYMKDEGGSDVEEPEEPEEPEEVLTYTWTPDSEAETSLAVPENEIVLVTDEIANYYGTVGTLKSMLDSDVSTRIEVTNGNTAGAMIYSDNQALAENMYVRVSDVNNSANCTYYRLTTAISSDMYVENLSMNKFSEYITASRIIKTYRTELGKKAKLIATTYDANGKLTDISIDEKDISSANIYKFSVGVYEGAQTKIMLWLDDMKPYDAATPYSE